MNGPGSDFKVSGITLDPRPVAKRIGLVALATDNTTEREYARICDPELTGVYVARVAYANPTTPENLRSMGPHIQAAAQSILPDQDLDVIAYACTAASVVLGDDHVFEAMRQAKPGASCVTPTSAAFAAFSALGVERISVLTPYTRLVTEEITAYLESNGLTVVNAGHMGLEDDRDMARVSTKSILQAGVEAMDPEADALFISCTALRAAECVQAIETQTGKPVVTSNQAMVWRSLRLAGDDRRLIGYGRLFDH